MGDGTKTETIFAEAADLASAAARSEFLDRVCAGNPLLREDVESLLKAHDDAGEFMRRADTVETARVTSVLPQASNGAEPRLPGFTIKRVLGHGGLGTVFEAWDEKLQRKVAIKTLKAPGDTRGRVLDEARKAAGLRDPGLVTIHAVLDEVEPPAIVMELVEGVPLDEYAASLTFEQKARVLQTIARALAAAHGFGIIHRDLKPANILLTPTLRPVILDFGLALHEDEAIRTERHFEGTPLYASPEQARGEAVTSASDVFSFGSVMFKLLTGATPYNGPDLASVLTAICSAKPPFPRDLAIGVPADLQAICLACFAADPAQRPTANELALDLGRFLAGEPVRLRPALYGDMLRQRISAYDNDLVNWQHQGMISAEEKDRLELVHRRILSDEDHWLIDSRRLTLAQTVLYTSTWLVVVSAGLLVWLARNELSATAQWVLPLVGTTLLVAVGLLAQHRKEPLAAASFLAGSVLSVVPTVLSAVAAFHLWSTPSKVEQLFPGVFTNQQVLVAGWTALGLSTFALARLRMTCFAWTTCVLGAAAYLSVLLQWDWLGRKPEVMALWLLPLTLFTAVALVFERVGRIRWTIPFYVIALLVLVGALDVMAGAGPTFNMVGLNERVAAYLNHERQQWLSFAANGVLFLVLMLVTERARSLDLRRGSRVLEIAAILHVLGGLYRNAIQNRGAASVGVDVGLYLGAVVLFLVMGPWRSRWRMLVGALTGVALGSYLLVDLKLVPKTPFILGLGATGLVISIAAYGYLLVIPGWRRGKTGE